MKYPFLSIVYLVYISFSIILVPASGESLLPKDGENYENYTKRLDKKFSEERSNRWRLLPKEGEGLDSYRDRLSEKFLLPQEGEKSEKYSIRLRGILEPQFEIEEGKDYENEKEAVSSANNVIEYVAPVLDHQLESLQGRVPEVDWPRNVRGRKSDETFPDYVTRINNENVGRPSISDSEFSRGLYTAAWIIGGIFAQCVLTFVGFRLFKSIL